MTIIEKIVAICDSLSLSVEVGSDENEERPDNYAVIVPITDNYTQFADDEPTHECNKVRMAIYTKGDYTQLVTQLSQAMLNAGLCITSRGFVERERDTRLYHYNIDAESVSEANTGM